MQNLPPAFAAAIIFIFGLTLGSFLNVVVYRLPRRQSLVSPPSSCPSCKAKLGLAELLPVMGYILLRGRCRHCGAMISVRYPLVELLTGALFVLLYLYFGLTIELLMNLILFFLLLAISLIDLEHRIVPNILVAIGLIAGLLFYLPQLLSHITTVPAGLLTALPFPDALGGMLLGGGIMLIIFIVSRGGMGAGDLKLMAMIGLYSGLRGTAMVMMLGFMFGAIVGVAFMAFKILTRKDALPFAPFLSSAALIVTLWGEDIWNWYINLL